MRFPLKEDDISGSIHPRIKIRGILETVMKRIFILLFFLALAILGIIWWGQNIKSVSSDKSVKSIVIPKGSSAGAIGTRLAQAGLIKNSLIFRIYTRITGTAGKIQAGEYLLSPSSPLTKIVEYLTNGPVEVWVTVPEGMRREEIADKFVSGLGKNGEDVTVFRDEFLNRSSGLEGFLFPDTYLFPKDASASAVVAKLKSTFDLRVDSKMKEDISKSAYDLGQIISLAAIIERETITPGERPVVAGILYKRLKAGWPLQVDATIQYALSSQKCSVGTGCNWWPNVSIDDRAINSRYNTYKFAGLPPTPIASPGLSSIKAAIYPEDSPYWYYLHDSKEVIHYARTLEEHNQNINKYIM